MSDNSKIREFPDISNKLTAPTKKSLFERQKADAEAKRQREEAETAAVYKDFLASFDEDEDTARRSGYGGRQEDTGGSLGLRGPPAGAAVAAPRRHFGASAGQRSSGPGSLGPPPSFSRKRAFDGSHPAQQDKERGLFAFENSSSGQVDAVTAFQTSDDEDERTASNKAAERAAPKPTLHLSSLPLGASPALIKSLIPPTLTVDEVKILPQLAPSGSTERRFSSAIATLAKDTPASDIDTAVNSLQNRYLGWGCYLSISRHLSSAALGSLASTTSLGSGLSSLPFGARQVFTGPGNSLSRAPPPPSHRGGFAPPQSYGPQGVGQFNRTAAVQVAVNPPSDLKQLKLIHKTLEALLSHGPEFEALLMSRPEVQRSEKWAWLWNPRSPGGVWYRWRLWEILTGSKKTAPVRGQYGSVNTQKMFDGGAPWASPEKGLNFEYTTRFDELVSDPDYDSSEDDESGDEGQQRRQNNSGGPPPEGGLSAPVLEKSYLNPFRKAKLTHLLARLPTSTARLRKGDVARVAAFAIGHAGEGADEVVDVIVSNIEKPFAMSGANVDRRKEDDDAERRDDEEEGDDKKPSKEDDSSSKLIGLYVVSDILSSSSTSGVRHAWRYRQLFETALKTRKIFERLGRLEKDLQWGRLRAEKWKRSVNSLLALWEGWCVFPQVAQERFMEMFNNPPLTDEEKVDAAKKEDERATAARLGKSKWKTVQVTGQPSAASSTSQGGAYGHHEEAMIEDVDGEPMSDGDVDGEPMMDEDLDGEPMEDVDGAPLLEDDDDGGPMEEDTAPNRKPQLGGPTLGVAPESEDETSAAKAKRLRPKAEDMFADSDEE